ncbi:uncharacterized protein [Dermacentor andersoni]|uniref:uncharacterized protein isoform X1 n=2 Tax=Dermacentor andersoni TaxID=34620 RepID=UPI003B3A8725
MDEADYNRSDEEEYDGDGPGLITGVIGLLSPKREPEEIVCAVDCSGGFLTTQIDLSEGDVEPYSPKCKMEEVDLAAEGSYDPSLFGPSQATDTEKPQRTQKAESKGCQASIATEKPQKTESKGCQTTRSTKTKKRKKSASDEVLFAAGKDSVITERLVFCCEECGDTFSAAKHLHQHRQTSHRPKPEGKHQCSYCTYSSNNKNHVMIHERKHTGECPFTCNLCKKGFYRAEDAKRHQRLHTKEKSYACDVCGQCFNVHSNMKRHRKLHTGDAEVYACPDCGKAFAQKAHLQSHLRTHTGERPFQCSQCHQRFTEVGSMRKHERMMHAGEYPHHCPHCGKGLANNFKLKKHVRACRV